MTLVRSQPFDPGIDYLSEREVAFVQAPVISISTSGTSSLSIGLPEHDPHVGTLRSYPRVIPYLDSFSFASPSWSDSPLERATRAALKGPRRVLTVGNAVFVFTVADSNWLEPTLDRIDNLLTLNVEETAGRNVAPNPDSVTQALTFLARGLPSGAAAPSLAPLNDGGLQVEWHRGGLDVEVTFSPDESDRGVYVRNKATGEEQEFPLDERAFAAAVGDRLNVVR